MRPILLFFKSFITRNQLYFSSLVLSLLLFTVAPWQTVSASHAAGGYLSYKWLYGNTYQFTVTFYKDCSSATLAPDSMKIDFTSATCKDSFSVVAPQVAGTGQEIGYPCASATTCDGGSNPGYRKYVYQTTATFNMQCTDWIMSFQPGPNVFPPQVLGRNNSITTIQEQCLDAYSNPTQCDLYTETDLNNLDYPTGSSISFNNDPIFFVCSGQPTVFNLGATNPDGDSLSYELVPAQQQDPNSLVVSNVSYIAPLSGANPLFPVGSVTINSSTGDLSINTSTLQVGVLAIQVSQYRNGVSKGSVVIDIQVVVQACANNHNPTLSGINGTPSIIDSVCAGSTVSFSLYSEDVDSDQIVTMTWDNGIPAPASFIVSGTPDPTGTFTWTTSQADASSQPHTFTVTVQDNFCPINGSQTQSYSIYVIGTVISVNPPSPQVCNGEPVTLTASGGSNYSWSPSTGLSSDTGATVLANPASATTYTITALNGGKCNAADTVVVTLTNISASAGHDTAFCAGNAIQLNASGGTNFSWSPSTGLTDTDIANPYDTSTVIAATTYTVTVSSGSCSVTSSVTINVFSGLPTPNIYKNAGQDTLFCTTDPSYASYQWYDSTYLIPNATDTFLVVTQSGNYNVAVHNANGCAVSAGINIIIGVDVFQPYGVYGSTYTISPNPAGDEITIIRNNKQQQTGTPYLTIFNVLGEKLFSHSMESTLNISRLPAGVYFIQVQDSQSRWIGKFVKE